MKSHLPKGKLQLLKCTVKSSLNILSGRDKNAKLPIIAFDHVKFVIRKKVKIIAIKINVIALDPPIERQTLSQQIKKHNVQL